MKGAGLPDKLPDRRIEPFLRGLAQSRASTLLLDYDGTLAPFRVDRHRAVPYPGVSMLLQEIMNTGHTRVLIVTGRRAHDIVPLLGVTPPPEIWGAYGLQRLKPDGTCEMPNIDQTVVQALNNAGQWLSEVGFSNLGETKPASLAVHWRGLGESVADNVRTVVLQGWQPIADRAQMILQDFDGGLEIQMSGSNKGDALRDLIRSLAPGTSLAYLGDDQTDEDAFRVVQRRGLGILVRPEWRETLAEAWLRPPAELVNFLFQWLASIWCAMGVSADRVSQISLLTEGLVSEERF